MIAFEVHLNGKKVCTAGAGEFGDLTAGLDWRRGPHVSPATGFEHDFELLELVVGGVSVRYKEKKAPHLKPGFAYTHSLEWLRRKVQPGDEVTIKVVDVPSADKPRKRIKVPTPNDTLQSHKRYVRGAAKALGWKIQK
jgi:hypothetical protein